jgi:D-3-phosphoglycerate dehydrogenase
MKLADQLGAFAGQATETGIMKVTVEYEGQVAALNTRPLTALMLQGLLKPLLSDSVNMVNAPLVAKERNIDLTEIKHDREGDYHTLIRLTVESERWARSIAGTLFADQRPRVVEIKGIKIDAELGPHMLYVTNDDKPGFIGRLGTLLGDNGINIATFALGRSAPGKDAIALVEIDGPMPPALLRQVQDLAQVQQAKHLVF